MRDKDGEASLFGAFQRGIHRLFALFDVARNILDHHDGVIHNETCGDGQRHHREVVQAVAREVHDSKVPTSESGTAMLGIIVAERLRRNRKMTITTSPMVSRSSNSTSFTEARMATVRVSDDLNVDRGRQRGFERW